MSIFVAASLNFQIITAFIPHATLKKQLLILFIFTTFFTNVFAQDTTDRQVPLKQDSTIVKTIEIQEVQVIQRKATQISGTSSGRVSLFTEGIKSIPTLMGATDVLKVLELTPGVQTSGEGKSNIHVRGGDPGQTLLLYADIPIYTPGHALNIFPLFNADHLSTTELIKGGVSAGYGNFLSGAIISQPKTVVPQKTSLKGSVGLLSSQATADFRINNKFGAYASARKTYLNLLTRPFLDNTVNRNAKNPVDNLLYDFHDVSATVIGVLSDRNKLLINFLAGQDELQVAEDYVGTNSLLRWVNSGASVQLETHLGEYSKLTQQFIYSRFQNNLQASLSDIEIKSFSNISSLGYNSKVDYRLKKIPFESGIQYKYYQLYPQEFEKSQSGLQHPDIAFGENNAHNVSVFTSATLTLMSQLTLETGIRYDYFHSLIARTQKEKDFHSVDFRLSGRYRLNEMQIVRATFSQNTQYVSKLFPSSTGLPTDFWVAASSEIRPQRGNEVSFGYYQAVFDGVFDFSSDIYYRKMNNVMEYNQNFIESESSVFTEKVMFGTGWAYGIELMLKKNVGKLTGWLSYSLGRSERRFPEINDGEIFPAKHDRIHDFALTTNYALNEKWDFSLTQIYATGNPYTVPTSWYFISNMPVQEYGKYNASRLPNYNRTDISVNYWFKENNGINFSIYNVFARHNPLYVSLSVEEVEGRKDKLRLMMRRRTLFTIMPSISWRFKF